MRPLDEAIKDVGKFGYDLSESGPENLILMDDAEGLDSFFNQYGLGFTHTEMDFYGNGILKDVYAVSLWDGESAWDVHFCPESDVVALYAQRLEDPERALGVERLQAGEPTLEPGVQYHQEFENLDSGWGFFNGPQKGSAD